MPGADNQVLRRPMGLGLLQRAGGFVQAVLESLNGKITSGLATSLQLVADGSLQESKLL